MPGITHHRSAPDALAIHQWHRRSSIQDPLLAAQPYPIHIADGYADRIANSDRFAYGYADTNGHEYAHEYGDAYADSHDHGNAYFNRHAYSDTTR
jgi:hypothetical protein